MSRRLVEGPFWGLVGRGGGGQMRKHVCWFGRDQSSWTHSEEEEGRQEGRGGRRGVGGVKREVGASGWRGENSGRMMIELEYPDFLHT